MIQGVAEDGQIQPILRAYTIKRGGERTGRASKRDNKRSRRETDVRQMGERKVGRNE